MLQKLILCSVNVTAQQMTELFLKLTKTGKLKHLDIEAIGDGGILKTIPSTLFSEVIRNIHTVNLSYSKVRKCQLKHLLKDLQGDFKLKSLNLSSNSNLALVPPKFISSIANLHKLNVSGCDLSATQIRILFRGVRDNKCMRELDISYNNLTQVSIETIASVLSVLQRLNLSYSWLTQEGINFVLKKLSERSAVTTFLDIRQKLPFRKIEDIKEEARKLDILYLLKI